MLKIQQTYIFVSVYINFQNKVNTHDCAEHSQSDKIHNDICMKHSNLCLSNSLYLEYIVLSFYGLVNISNCLLHCYQMLYNRFVVHRPTEKCQCTFFQSLSISVGCHSPKLEVIKSSKKLKE